jgi:hypothetical protein
MLLKSTTSLLLVIGLSIAANSALADLVKPPTIKKIESLGSTSKKIIKQKPAVKYIVVKACNTGEFLFLQEKTKKSGSPFWQVRLADGKASTKDVLIATDTRFSLVQNQTQGLNPVILSEIRNYSTKALMEMDIQGQNCI